MRKRNRRNRREAEDATVQPPVQGKVAELFDIPANATFQMPQIELAGNREAVVDGCRGVLEYDENIIRLATEKMTIQFLGRSLQIRVLTHDSAIVTGFITSIEFIA